MVSLKQAKPLSLRANFSWTFAGNVVYAASQWGMLIVLARVGSPEMVGQFALGLAVTAPIIMFANLQLRTVQATDATRDYAFGDYFGLRIITTLLAFMVIVIVALAGYQSGTAEVIILIGVSKAFEALSDVIHGLFQQQERMDRIAQSMIIKGPMSLVALAGGVLLSGEVAGGIIGLVLVWGLIFLFYDLPGGILVLRAKSTDEEKAQIRPNFHFNVLYRLFWLALPLGFEGVIKSLNTNLPRLFIAHYFSEAELGYFAALGYITIAGRTVVYALGQASTARLAQYYSDDMSAFIRIVKKLLVLSAGMSISLILGSLLLGEEFLSFIYRPDYAQYTDVFILLMIGTGISYIWAPLWYSIVATHAFGKQMWISIIGLLTTFIGCQLFIPSLGLTGAALASILTATVLLVSFSGLLVWLIKKRGVRHAGSSD